MKRDPESVMLELYSITNPSDSKAATQKARTVTAILSLISPVCSRTREPGAPYCANPCRLADHIDASAVQIKLLPTGRPGGSRGARRRRCRRGRRGLGRNVELLPNNDLVGLQGIERTKRFDAHPELARDPRQAIAGFDCVDLPGRRGARRGAATHRSGGCG